MSIAAKLGVAELDDVIGQAGGAIQERAVFVNGFCPVVRVVPGRPQLEDLLCIGVIGIQGAPVDGPAAVGNPGPLLKINRIERGTEAAPAVRCSSEAPVLGGRK
jgi:hypothetical protein